MLGMLCLSRNKARRIKRQAGEGMSLFNGEVDAKHKLLSASSVLSGQELEISI